MIWASEIEVLSDDLLEENPPGQRSIQHLCERDLRLEDRDIVSVTRPPIFAAERVREPPQPLADEELDPGRGEIIADFLGSLRIVAREHAVVQRLIRDTFACQLPFQVLVPVEADLAVIGKVGTQFEKERAKVSIDAVEVVLVAHCCGLDQSGIALAGPRIDPALGSHNGSLLLCLANKENAFRLREPGQVLLGDLILALPFLEGHQVDALLLRQSLDAEYEGSAHRWYQCGAGELLAAMAEPEVGDTFWPLQNRYIQIQVQAVDILDFEGDMLCTAIRADEIDKPGIITSQVIQRVVNDPLVVADLTERNPNVFYELAIRHALRKPLVQLIKKGERIPFDVAGTRTIQVDHRDLDSVEAARNEIIEQVRSLEKDSSDIETPISVSLDLQLLRQSENPEERSLADLVAAVADLRTGLAKIEARIGTKDEEGVLDEIQSALKTLPRRLDDYFESTGGPLSPSRRARLHPRIIREMMRFGPEYGGSSAVSVLILASLFRDSRPWLYEVGLEAYRLLKKGDFKAGRRAIKEFQQLAMSSLHAPWRRELLGRSKEMFILFDRLEPMLDDLLLNVEREYGIAARSRRRGPVIGNSDETA